MATTVDLVPRTVYRTSLLNRELVLWRADDGFVNVWENRCLHRGVRLSIGSNDGAELICRYHGWRYSNRSGGCTYVPAHPADSPARTIQNTTYPAVEHLGLIWTTGNPIDEMPPFAVPELEAMAGEILGLRNLPVAAPWQVVIAALAEHRFCPPGALDVDPAEAEMSANTDGLAVTLTSSVGDHRSSAVFVVQPLEPGRSVVRPVLGERPPDPIGVLRHHATALARFAKATEAREWATPTEQPVALENPVVLPSTSTATRRSALTEVTVAAKRLVANHIIALELSPVDGVALPTWQPGDHLDLHLPNGLIRQYSITNRPGWSDRYRIGVKREAASRGGSAFLHDSIAVGDVLTVSEPRSGFPLRRNVPQTLFIAGGIGITPLLSMAHALSSMRLAFTFHYFTADPADIAFVDDLDYFGDVVKQHLGLSPHETVAALREVLDRPEAGGQIYACGPPPMLDAIRSIAADAGWPDDAVRFEYFENTTQIDASSSFTVELARSATTLTVSAGQTILQVLREHDIPIVSSCEQGACGTCVATVIDGEPHHQDVYLSAEERAAGKLILTCVSRTLADRLVLDL
ncbi:MAG: Rieske 2Fe-2S domain-containing protein [Actinomycetota bacterium]